MKSKKIFHWAMAYILTSLLFTVILSAPGSESIDWWVIGSGGGQITSGNLSLESVIGQAAAGDVSSNGTKLYAGFIYGVSGASIYLPVLMRSNP